MKELTTTKPLVLGLVGLPGAGKTHFAREFSTMFGAPLVETDALRRAIFGDSPLTKGAEDGLRRANSIVMTELFKSNRMFAVDGNLATFKDRSEIRSLAKKAGYDVLWVWVQTNETIAEDRAIKHKRGATNTLLSRADFKRAVATFEPPRANEELIVISGQRTFTSQVRPILVKIAEGHEARLQTPQATERPDSDASRPPRRNIFIR